MKSYRYACLATLLFTLAGPSASAEMASSSGAIGFSGGIFTASCNMKVIPNPATFYCSDPQNGQTIVRTADLMKSQSLDSLPVTVATHWLDAAKRKGIVSVTYL